MLKALDIVFPSERLILSDCFHLVLLKSNSIKSQMAIVLTILIALKFFNAIIEQYDKGLRIFWINIHHISVLKIERPLPWSIDADGLVHM